MDKGLMADRQLRLGAFMRPVGIHTGWWRYPGAYPDANFNFQHLKGFAQTLERGKFDAFFMADHLAVLNMPIKALRRSATVTSFEPFTLLSALAGATERIGLIATASTPVNAGARLHRFPEQRCINNADENALEHGLASWASGWGQIVFGRVCVVAG
jgi:hypothetical protein